MSTSIQRPLPLRVDLRIPVLDLRGARGVLGVDESEIREMIEDGRLAWAWNIGTQSAARTELRVLGANIRDLQYGGEPIERSTEEVGELILGSPRPFIYGRDWHRAWNCDSGHMINLVSEGSLNTVAGSDPWRRGPGGSPCIAWDSAMQFITNRRIA